MAALPGTPRTWTDGEVTTESMFDAEISGSLAYLKGQAGAVVYSSPVSVVGLGSGLVLPGSRFHAVETGSGFAAAIENTKSTGTPNGLQVNIARAGTHRAFVAGSRDGAGVLNEVLAIDGNGLCLVNGRDRWTPPMYGAQTGALFNLSGSVQNIPSANFTIPRGGYWYISAMATVYTTSGGNDFAVIAVNGPGIASPGVADMTNPAVLFFSRLNAGTQTNSPLCLGAGRAVRFTGPGLVSLVANMQLGSNIGQLGQPSTICGWFMGD